MFNDDDNAAGVIFSVFQIADPIEEAKESITRIFGNNKDIFSKALALPEVVTLTSKFNTESLQAFNTEEEDYTKRLSNELQVIFAALSQAKAGEIDKDDLEFALDLPIIEITEIFGEANIDSAYGHYSEEDDFDLREDHATLVNEALRSMSRFIRGEIPTPGQHIS